MADDRISPWEMFEAGLGVEQVLAEAPALPEELRARLLATVRRLVRDPRFEMFATPPSPLTHHSTGAPLQITV